MLGVRRAVDRRASVRGGSLKFCQPHWNKLRTAIDARGLSGLVAQGGENAVARQFDQLQRSQNAEEAVTKTNFDPLMGAHWAIVNNAMNLVGLSLMLPNEDGSERCPLCFIQGEHDANCTKDGCTYKYDTWIEFAARDMLEEAKRLGLVAAS